MMYRCAQYTCQHIVDTIIIQFKSYEPRFIGFYISEIYDMLRCRISQTIMNLEIFISTVNGAPKKA